MGIENVSFEVLQSVGLQCPAIVVRRAPSRFSELRATYRLARASIPPRVRDCAVASVVTRALVLGRITWREIESGRRIYSPTRQKIAWVLYEAMGWSSKVTARILGQQDHTSVIHARRRIGGLIQCGVATDRGAPFLRPRDVAKVSRLKARRIDLVAAREAAFKAEIVAEREARVTYMARLEADALNRIAKHIDPAGIEIIRTAAVAEGRGVRHLFGPSDSIEATRARDAACSRLGVAGYTRATLAAAFQISERHITQAMNRGARFLGECVQ